MDVTAEHREPPTGTPLRRAVDREEGRVTPGVDGRLLLRRRQHPRHPPARQREVPQHQPPTPRRVSVPDGRRSLTVYGTGELLEDDPARVDAFQAILMSYGMPESPVDDLRTSMDDEQRVVLRLHPTSMDLHE